MKIKGWEKISGYTYKGYCIVNPIHNAHKTKYMADVLDLNQQHKPKWELVVMTPEYEGKAVRDDWFEILLWDDNKFCTRDDMTKPMMDKISNFRQTFEGLVDEMIQLRLSLNGTTGPSQGIINQVQTAGTHVTYSSHSISNGLNNLSVMQQALNAMRELEEQLDELKKQYPL